MKYINLMLLLIFIYEGSIAQKRVVKSQQEKTAVALLGVYHFDNPNQDQFNVTSDSILSEKRQREIAALVKRLSAYKPTHIAVEFNKNDSALDQRYQLYLQGKYTLTANEREQLGFRLARLLGHPHIYPIDEPSIMLNFNPTDEIATAYGPLLTELSEIGNRIIEMINAWVREKTIGNVLYRLNSDSLDKLNIDLYYRYLLPVGTGDLQPGTDALVSWYKRNLIIFRYLKELCNTGGSKKRILVIFGQAHTAMLKQFMQYSNEFELIDIRNLLPDK